VSESIFRIANYERRQQMSLQLNDNNFYCFFNYILIVKCNLLSSVANIASGEKRSAFLHLLISVFVGTSEENSSFRIRGAIAADMKAK
jgi:hypothetical protein